jgi:hypothetical protein
MSAPRRYRGLALGLCLAGCAFSVAPTEPEDRQITLELAVFPERISVEDSLATAEVWATVKQGSKPIKDSTVVAFASTVGTITATSLTRDGLAVALLTGPGDNRPRTGEVVAQVLTVRDTLEIDLVFFEQE